jgi:Divergent InlB B-repeat domain
MLVLSSSPLQSSFQRWSSRFRSRGPAILLALAAVLAPGVAGAGQLQLSWADNSGGEAGFRIERKTGTAGAYAELDLQSSGITSYVDASALDGTTYCYRVQAYSDTSVSAYSNEACGTLATGLVVTVSLAGTGKGTVNSSPSGISCGTDCVETYPSGAVVTLSASAASDSTFGGWGGGCAGTDPCTLTGNAPVSVSATFVAAPSASYTLSAAKSGPGTVTSGPAGINCGSDCSESYASGTAVTLTATPANGARFVGWGGACSGTGTCALQLTAATSVSATFSKGRGKK